MSWVILLSFLAGTGHVSKHMLQCPDWPCVERIEAAAPMSTTLIRIEVWRRRDYSPVPTTGLTPFPPLLDYWRQ